MPTIKDVAALSGVAKSTVSNVLNGKGNVSGDVKDRVGKAVAELGYFPNPIARGLSLAKSANRYLDAPVHGLGTGFDPDSAAVLLMTRMSDSVRIRNCLFVPAEGAVFALDVIENAYPGIGFKCEGYLRTFAEGEGLARRARGFDAVIFSSPHAAAGYLVTVSHGAVVGSIADDPLLAGLDRDIFVLRMGNPPEVVLYSKTTGRTPGFGDDDELLD